VRQPPATIEQQAATMATSALAFEKAEIERQRALAAARAERDRMALTGLASAAAQMQQGIGPGIQGAYGAAAGQVGDLAKGFTGALADRMGAGQEASVAAAQAQGAPVGALGPNVDAQRDVMYGLGGYIPGADLARQGAAAATWGQGLPSITAAALSGDFRRAMHEAAAQDDEYAQQLIQHAAKFPAERDRALEELRGYELEKKKFAFDQQQATREHGLNVRQVGIQERAQGLYEKQFGEEVRSTRVKEKLAAHELILEGQKLALDRKEYVADVKNAAKKGRQIDASASKVYGFIVDKQGNFVLDKKGRKIKVKAAKGSSSGTQEERNPYGAAVEAAKTLRGEPLEAPSDKLPPPRGQYIARQGIRGVFPDGTTNNPALARRDADMTFAEAQGYLQARYGLSRAKARQALVASGWKPDGARPSTRRTGR
jgi:hypothetical protein